MYPYLFDQQVVIKTVAALKLGFHAMGQFRFQHQDLSILSFNYHNV